MATGPSLGRQAATTRPAPPFDDVYREHHRRVFAICLGYLGNADDAEDATQETFVKAARHLVGFEGNVAAYLTVVARNVCCDEVRRRTLHRRATGELGRGSGTQEIESTAVDRSILSRLIPRLTRGERELLLHSFAGYSYDEIADRTGAPVGTVRVRLARARKRARGLASGLAALLLLPRAWGWARRASQAPAGPDQGAALAGAVVVGVVAVSLATGLGVGTRPLRSAAPLTGGIAQTAVRPSSAPVNGGGPPAASLVAGTQPGGGAPRAAGGGAQPASVPSATPQVLVPHGYEVTPDQAWGDGVSASSSGGGPVFLWSRTGATCNVVCELLYRSDDSGRTWQHLAADGLKAGRLLVPDSFGTNHTLFVVTGRTLLVSRDGGQSFTDSGMAAPGAATLLPDDGSGHAQIAVASGLDVVAYDAQTSQQRTVTTISSINYDAIDDVAYAGQTLLVSAERTAVDNTGTESPPVVLACTPPGCSEKAHGFHSRVVALEPVIGDRNVVLIVDDAADIYPTTDGSRGYRLASGLAGDAVKVTSARATATGIHVVLQAQRPGGFDEALLRDGATAPLHAVPNGEVEAFLLLPGDVILAAGADVNAASLPGIRCSHDLGASWMQRC